MAPDTTHRPPRPSNSAAPGLVAWLLATVAIGGLVGCGDTAPAGWAGYVEGEYVYVAAPVAGTLSELKAQAGQTVVRGAALFQLDDVASRAARAQGDAQLAAAAAQAANTTKGRRDDEVAVTRAQLQQARALAERAEADLQRQQQLVAQGFISRSNLDDATTAVAQARSRVAELEAAWRVAELPSRPDEQAAARANTSAAAQALAQLQWREGQALQQAPADALVADTFFRVGEYVPAGQPVLSLLPPAGRKARFYVPETERGALAPGQAVNIRCDGCGATIAAHISRIATQAEYTPPVIYSNAQRAKLVFMVEALPAPADALRLQPGQPISVVRAP